MNLELRHEPAREQAPLAEPDFARWRSEDGEVRAGGDASASRELAPGPGKS